MSQQLLAVYGSFYVRQRLALSRLPTDLALLPPQTDLWVLCGGCCVQMDPKFLRNQRFAKKYNKGAKKVAE